MPKNSKRLAVKVVQSINLTADDVAVIEEIQQLSGILSKTDLFRSGLRALRREILRGAAGPRRARAAERAEEPISRVG